MNRVILPFVVLAASSVSALPQELTKCVAGQQVVDREGKTGIIVADDNKLCQVKYADGQIYNWIFWNLRPTTASDKPASPAPGAATPPTNTPANLTVLRPASSRSLVYRADRRGHFSLMAMINGAPLRLVVDTGASLVALTLDDAQAAGIGRSELVFSQLTHTANGTVRFAPVLLREIRIEQLAVDNVPAAVIENLDQSLLGMSFLKRLKSFEMRDGALTIGW
ncbi:MAG: TIGR02281 family clan AA aspartic protease [Alphaproteobacteria bacterium]|nr:TIGR02281 family clan AA aspartic protease [Alphaproteobacteria bacterium]MBV9375727.1 TIGR02281 family clan AA aspartic protease [Alphaproteobacteria bacterium]